MHAAWIHLKIVLWATTLTLSCFAWLGVSQQVCAADEGGRERSVETDSSANYARLIRVPLPLRGAVDTQVRVALDQILSSLPPSQENRPVIVLEFWSADDAQGASEFGRALDLARYLASARTAGIRTVAYIPDTIRGHAVLVALAAEEIIMHPDAKLGAAGVGEENIDPTIRRGYAEIANRRRTIPPAIALGMLDPQLQVYRATTGAGDRYVLEEELEQLRKDAVVQTIDTVFPAGQEGIISGDKLRVEYGFVSHLAKNRRELAGALDVAPHQLEIDPTYGGSWQAIRLDLDGPVTPVIAAQLMRSVEDRLRRDSVNFICVAINSPGGSIEDSLHLAGFLSDLDSTRIRTVSYVSGEARADAALIALACDQLVMHPDAMLGGGNLTTEVDPQLSMLTIKSIAEKKQRSWSPLAACLNRELELFRYQLAETDTNELFCAGELEEQSDPTDWVQGEQVVEQGVLLELTGKEALRVGIARHTAANFDEFRQKYDLQDNPELVEPNWAHEIIAALATPQVAAGLLFIGFFAMVAELSAPGIGVGGFLAAVCFLLFFWSNYLQGTAGWLEVLLFLAGLFFIAMEVFVLPGLGIFGVGGAFLVLMSLILASQTFVIPRTDAQFSQLPRSVLTVFGAMAGVVISLFLLRKQLEQSPILRQAMLIPPEGAAANAMLQREAVVQYDHLHGSVGRATTPLVPAGKADFDGELIDVISDGLPVARHACVKVIEVSGNRVVVSEHTE